MEQLRVVETTNGPLTYCLIRKRVKNLNLRVERDGQVVLSVPMGCALSYADQFIREKSAWILRGQQRQRAAKQAELGPELSREESYERLKAALDEVYPLVAPLGVEYPELKLRKMKSQWGNCHWRQGYITLNTALARCPEHLRQYVALHELVHFLNHDHGPQFHAWMDHLMPEWKKCRQELKQYVAALEM